MANPTPLKTVNSESRDEPGGTKSRLSISTLGTFGKTAISIGSTILFPVVVMFASVGAAKWFGIAEFSNRIDVTKIKDNPWIFALLLGQTAVMSVWFWSQIKVVRDMHTKVDSLRAETKTSVFMSGLMLLVAGYMLGSYGSVYWAFVIPAIFQVMDGFTTPDTAINNAAQKPLMQRE
ncbi:hypothetical protein EBR66_03075 [bacterium]|nr:hypothetical protein [bacterium]